MANSDTPQGFWPVDHLTGGDISRTRVYPMTASTTIYQGDLLAITTTGTVEPAETGDGNSVIGVAAQYMVSGTGTSRIAVYDDPNIIFGIQSDSGTAVAESSITQTADFVAGSGSATTQLSGHELDSDAIGDSAQLKILGKIEELGNTWGEHVNLRVLLNEHRFHGDGDEGDVNVSERCKVNVAAGITKGDVVYTNGATGGFMQVGLADNTDHDKAHVYGVAAETKANGETVVIRRTGSITGLDTSSFSEGDRLHLITAGQLQTAVPTNGAHIHVGFVKKSNANTGSISVHPEDFVHDIAAASGQDLEMQMGDAAGSNKVSFKDYGNVEVASIDSDGLATFDEVTFNDVNGTANNLSDVDHHVKDLNEELLTTKFDMTGATAAGVYTITATSSDAPEETLEGIIAGKELLASSSSEEVDVESLKGTDASPNNVYVYFKNDGSDNLEIAASNTSPDGGVVEHVDGVYMKLGSVAGSTSNVYAVNNVKAYANAKLEEMLDRFKEQGTLYKSGMAITSDADSLAITSGTARHVLGSATTPALEVDRATPVDNLFYIQNGGTWVTETDWSLAEYSDGVAFATAQFMKVRMGVCINNPELTSARWFAIPQNGATTYNTAAKAWLDAANMAVTTPSDDIVKYAFLPIADVVIRNNAGTYTLQQDPNTSLYHQDVRGQAAGEGGGGGAAAQNVYETFIGDSGTTTASSSSDTMDIEGGTGITTAVTSDKVTITGHLESHTVASHSDTTATGAELEELTDGSTTTLHNHSGGGTTWLYAYKPSDETVTSSTTLQDDDDLVVAVAANSFYHFSLLMLFSADSVPDIKGSWSIPSGATIYQRDVTTASISAQNESYVFVYNGGGAGVYYCVVIEGYLETAGNAGNFQWQFAQNSSSAAATTMRKGSNLLALKVS